MLLPDVVAAPAGRPLARLDKRAGDARVYRIDCAPLLRQHELMVRVVECRPTGVEVGSARTRGGRFVEVMLSGGGGGPDRYTDGQLSVTVATSMGQLEVCIAVRVHGAAA